jgi:hypothetical protein
MNKKFFILLILIIAISATLFGIKLEKSDFKKAENSSFDSDYLFYGNELDFSGSADDLYFFGEKLNFTGDTNSSLTAFGKEIVINGKVKNNLMTGGISVNVFGEIDDTAFISGKNIEIQKNSIINGTLFIAGKNIILSGTVNGDVIIAGADFTIDGVINGDMRVYTGKINITNNGTVNGNLKYQSENELSKEEKSRIKKSIEFNKSSRIAKKFNHVKEKDFDRFCKIGFFIFKFFILITFIISGLLILLLPIMKNIEEERSSKRFWLSSLWGLLPILIFPAIVFLFFMFGITIPLAFLIILSGFPLLILSKILGVTMFGQYLFKKFKWNKSNRLLWFLFGLIFYAILNFIPFIAFISMIFFSSLGWGNIIEVLFNKKLS